MPPVTSAATLVATSTAAATGGDRDPRGDGARRLRQQPPGQFIYDDEETIVGNPYVRTLWPVTAAMHAPAQSAAAGRPLISLSLALNYALGGLAPAGYHAFNLVVHLTAALLLFGIVRRVLRGQRVPARLGDRADAWALGVALIWLVHPLQTEVIDYTIQRTESMMGVCYLLTLYAGIRGMQAPRYAGRWLAISIAACAAGAACKESIVTAPLMVWLYDGVFEAGSFRGALARRGGYYAGLLASWGMLAWLNIDGPRFRSAGLSAGVTPWTYLLNQGPIIATYLARTIWPHPLVADYGRTTAIPLAAAAPYLLLIAGLAASRSQRGGGTGGWRFSGPGSSLRSRRRRASCRSRPKSAPSVACICRSRRSSFLRRWSSTRLRARSLRSERRWPRS